VRHRVRSAGNRIVPRLNLVAHTGSVSMTLPSIVTWFGPPALSSLELRRSAHVLWLGTWPFFMTVCLALGIAVLVEPHTLARRTATVAAVGGLMAILHSVSRAGRPVLASWLLVTGLSVIVTQRAWITGGIHAPVAVFYALFIVMAGVLISTRAAAATAAVCFVGAIVLTVATSLEWLIPRPGAGSALGGFVFASFAIGLALLVQSLATFRHRRPALTFEAVQMFVHDMRSPIQILLAHLELLRSEVRGESEKDVEGAIKGATTLRTMTNSLLDLSRLEAGRMPVRRSVTELSVAASAVVASAHVLQPGRDITVEATGNTSCRCDPELVHRVIENLVSNALKHTPVEGRVRVVVSAVADTVSIAVHDEGPGVPRERQARIFEPYSAETLRGRYGYESSGLGLAFCRLAVEAHGGSIRIEDAAPRGTVFIVELPRFIGTGDHPQI
jgi:signal transduction histidine kinase